MGVNFIAPVRKPARLRAGANGYDNSPRYVPASLDEILSLQQCASWLQQPEQVLRDMIGNGTLKPLPFPGADHRLHARSVLLQMGIAGEALGNFQASTSTTNSTLAKADHNRGARADNGNVSAPAATTQPANEVTDNTVAERARNELAKAEARLNGVGKPKGPAARNPEPKEKVVRRSYESHGRVVEVTYRFGDSPRHRLAESNLLDVVVSALKPGRN